MENFNIVKLKIKDIESILKLQESSADSNICFFYEKEGLCRAVKNNRIVGIIKENKLIAYSMFHNISEKEYNYLPKNINNKKVGKFSGTVINKSYRGLGLHKKLLYSHLEYAKQNKYVSIMSYAHKENAASIKNINSVGLKFVGNNNNEKSKYNRNVYAIMLAS